MKLGIDIGTSSVKAVKVQGSHQTESIVFHHAYTNDSREQSVLSILKAVQTAILEIVYDTDNIEHVGMTGQMHGIVFWNANKVSNWRDRPEWNDTDPTSTWSNLITWEDQRATKQFISKLGIPGLQPGYGLATWAYLQEYHSESLEPYDCCGTIADLVGFLLGQEARSAAYNFIDPTNAHSWGGFDIEMNDWPINIRKQFGHMPQLVVSGTIIGKTCSLFQVPVDVPIIIAMGDHACSILALYSNDQQACMPRPLVMQLINLDLNIGTSAQLCIVMPTDKCVDDHHYAELRPFVQSKRLLVAASLNGGNIIASFVRNVHELVKQFSPTTSMDEIYDHFHSNTFQLHGTLFSCQPTFYGERQDPKALGSFQNMTIENLTIQQQYIALCQGVVDNLLRMLPLPDWITSIVGTGNALCLNSNIQNYLQAETRLTFETTKSAGAAFGAAMQK